MGDGQLVSNTVTVSPPPTVGDEDASPTTLTAAQHAEYHRHAADRSLTKLSHAITFLNNHMPVMGCRMYGTREEYSSNEIIWSPLFMDGVPDEARDAMTRAVVNAARYAGDYFEREGD